MRTKLTGFLATAVLVAAATSVAPSAAADYDDDLPGSDHQVAAGAVHIDFGSLGTIAFHTNRDGNNEIYTMLPDGGLQTNITSSPGDDWHPAFSRNGDKLVFESWRDGGSHQELYTIGNDGSHPVRLTKNDGYETEPSFTPDGKKILFATTLNFSAVGVDGSGYSTFADPTPGSELEPELSHDNRLVFSDYRDCGCPDMGIFVSNADGSGAVDLTPGPGRNWNPTWSADGRRIAYTRGTTWDKGDIWVMNADGSGKIRLTEHAAGDLEPAWSPDGKRIAFVSRRDANAEIYVMNADGSDETRLTTNPAADRYPAWAGPPVAGADPLPFVKKLNPCAYIPGCGDQPDPCPVCGRVAPEPVWTISPDELPRGGRL